MTLLGDRMAVVQCTLVELALREEVGNARRSFATLPHYVMTLCHDREALQPLPIWDDYHRALPDAVGAGHCNPYCGSSDSSSDSSR